MTSTTAPAVLHLATSAAAAPELAIERRVMQYIYECNYNIQYIVDEGSAEIIRELLDELETIQMKDPQNQILMNAHAHLDDTLYFAEKIEMGRVYSMDVLEMYENKIKQHTNQAYELIRETVGIAN